jgi:transcriptional regulator of acetoin/glycerol metabolism
VGTQDHPTESLVASGDGGAVAVRARVRTVAPRAVRWALELSGAPVTLGRAPEDGSPPLVHATVSRLHARIVWDAGRRAHRLEDLQSRHGTEVDGESASVAIELRDGAIVRLGGLFLAYERLPDDLVDPAEVSHDELPGESPAMMRLRAAIARAGSDAAAVTVIGATGTGKDRVVAELVRLGAVVGPDPAATAIAVPPLSARRGDIPMWIDRLWGGETPLPDLTSAAYAVLLGHDWPDNLRGVERLVHDLQTRRARGAPIDRTDLPAWVREEAPTERRPTFTPPTGTPLLRPVPPPIKPPVPSREAFEAAWKELAGNVRALARKYGRDRRQIYRWAEAYGLRAASAGDDSDDE